MAAEKGISEYKMAAQLDCHKNWHGWKTKKYKPSHEKMQRVLAKMNELENVTRIAHEIMQPVQIKLDPMEDTAGFVPPHQFLSVLRSDMSDSDKVSILSSLYL